MIEVPESKTEGTSYPWWFIVCPQHLNRFAKKDSLASSIATSIIGPFFSRETAEAHRKGREYEYGKNSIVWCGSGCWSRDYQDVMKVVAAQ